MLRVAEHVARTDTGRQRATNEDSHLERAAGLRRRRRDGRRPGRRGRLADSRSSTSRRDLARQDPARTPTRAARARGAATPTPDPRAVAGRRPARRHGHDADRRLRRRRARSFIAHVGDSRAYRLRDGRLERITEDHSLVEELLRQGRLTEEEAEEHPQRSIITRALGPEPDVEVDTLTVAAADGDVYLLCSDGLTSMVSEEAIADILAGAPDLAAAADELVAAALAAGGRDNVTVVLFRIEEVGGDAAGADRRAPRRTLPSSSSGPGGRRAARARRARGRRRAEPRDAPPPRAAAARSRGPAPRRRRAPRMPRRGARPPPRRRRSPLAAVLVTVLAVLAIAGVARGAVGVLRRHRRRRPGHVFNGLPYTLPGGVHLYTTFFVSGVTVAELSPARARAPVRQRAALASRRRAWSASSSSARSPASEPADRTPVRARARAVRAARRLHLALDGVRGQRAAREPEQQAPGPRGPARRRAARSSPPTARARPLGAPADGIYVRDYPFGPLFTPAIGYYDPYNGAAGSRSTATTCSPGSPPQQSSILDQLAGKPTDGDEVVTTLDPHAQQVAFAGLAGRNGAVVAIVPRPARSRCSRRARATTPTQVRPRRRSTRLGRPDRPLFDRATAGQYAPGSTFKVVTAIAAIDSGRYTPASLVNGRSPIDDLRPPAHQRRRDELRARLAQRRPDQLDQHRLGAGRAGGRRADAADLHEPARLLQARRRSTCRPTSSRRAACASAATAATCRCRGRRRRARRASARAASR